jgi:opacity protein-like surface antigen
MRIHRVQTYVLSVVALAVAYLAQGALAQTSVSASVYGAFSGTTNGNGTRQSPANQAGGLLEVRHISNPILGFEATYSFNRANQTYTTSPPGACPTIGCSSSTESVAANAHEVTADWVPSVHIANLRPFGVLGVGLLLDVPSNSTATVTTINPCPVCATPAGTTTATSTDSTSTTYKPVYVYGAGLDWGLLPHIGLRLQYRGNLYSSPNLTSLFSSTSTFTHTAEPMVGIYFRL